MAARNDDSNRFQGTALPQIYSAQIGIVKSGIPHIGFAQVSVVHIRIKMLGHAKRRAAEISVGEIGTAKISSGQIGSIQLRLTKRSATKIHPAQIETLEINHIRPPIKPFHENDQPNATSPRDIPFPRALQPSSAPAALDGSTP